MHTAGWSDEVMVEHAWISLGCCIAKYKYEYKYKYKHKFKCKYSRPDWWSKWWQNAAESPSAATALPSTNTYKYKYWLQTHIQIQQAGLMKWWQNAAESPSAAAASPYTWHMKCHNQHSEATPLWNYCSQWSLWIMTAFLMFQCYIALIDWSLNVLCFQLEGGSLWSESLDKTGVLYNSLIPQAGIGKTLPFGK